MYKSLVIVLLFAVLVNATKPKGPPPGGDGVPPGFAKVLSGKYQSVLDQLKKVFKDAKEKHHPPKKSEIDKIMKKVDKKTLAKLPKQPKD
ncbi:hypothetical protein DdX_20663 [Ditylenchus destructor]|uniref:Uncharacterized protein n=1 Tax=Ditylenchus destructor TaxID=166010 RepID=A0AAD4MK43_9BILA|nr:hypothetical protein DdX_20808 [Ditylenchus destructor]KAI1693417.1 hypothetical protein DdX_20663 [Ditylenchus destructor]